MLFLRHDGPPELNLGDVDRARRGLRDGTVPHVRVEELSLGTEELEHPLVD